MKYVVQFFNYKRASGTAYYRTLPNGTRVPVKEGDFEYHFTASSDQGAKAHVSRLSAGDTYDAANLFCIIPAGPYFSSELHIGSRTSKSRRWTDKLPA